MLPQILTRLDDFLLYLVPQSLGDLGISKLSNKLDTWDSYLAYC